MVGHGADGAGNPSTRTQRNGVFAPRHRFSAVARDGRSRDILGEAADRIQRSLREDANTVSPATVGMLLGEAIERASGTRITDQARLAAQVLLWHGEGDPSRARHLTVAALADRAGAIRRSAAAALPKRGPRQ
jgi:hypothetical protein